MTEKRDESVESRRVRKLRDWISSHFDGNVAAFVRAMNMKTSAGSHISQLLSGKRSLGIKAARKFEEHAGLPCGWFDSEASTPPPVKVKPRLFYYDRKRATILTEEDRKLVSNIIELMIKKRELELKKELDQRLQEARQHFRHFDHS